MDAFTFILKQFWISREMNKCGVKMFFEAMVMVPSTRAMLKVMLDFQGTFREKIWPSPEKSKNVPKTAEIEGYIIHGFWISRGPCSERHVMPSRDMGGHRKGVMWLGKKMRMPLRSFRGNFGFHEKWTNGVFEAFQGNKNGVKHPDYVTSYVATPRNFSAEKYDQAGRSPKMPQKHPKLKVIIHAFGFSRGPSSGRHGMPPKDMGGHWKGVMWLGTICRCLYVHLEAISGFTRNG